METSKLLHAFNNDQVENILAGMVGIFEKVFPERIYAYYVIGSYLDGTQLPTSDLDGYIIFKGDLSPAEYMKTLELGAECSQLSPIPLDFAPMPETSLRRHGTVDLKLASGLIYGTDIRDDLTLLDPTFYTYFMMEEAIQRIANVRQGAMLSYPVEYPDPADEFYGYASSGTKALLHAVGKPATAIVLLKTGQHVKNKRDSVARYQSEIADQWSPLVRDVYELCRNTWHYQIPPAESDRLILRALCEQARDFENHFLGLLRDFLLNALRQASDVSAWLTFMECQMFMGLSPDALQPLIASGAVSMREVEQEPQVLIADYNRHLVARMLARVVFPGDRELVEALQQVAQGENALLRQAAQRALEVQGQAD